MSAAGPAEITRLLKAWGSGDQAALDVLIPNIYDELRRMARRYAKRERAGRTLQATALINEVYLRLVDIHNVVWQDRAHFFAISARIMRRVLVDAARARAAGKRGGGYFQRVDHPTAVNLDEIPDLSSGRDRDMIRIDEALEGLAEMDPRKARVVELRFFAGLSVEEAAQVLAVSPQTVMRDWKLAKAWLSRELRRRG